MSFQNRLIELSGDFKRNPGPKPKSTQSFSICQWNLTDSFSFYNFLKIQLLTAYDCIHKHANTDFIKRALESLNWEKHFLITLLTKIFSILNKTVINIMSNFIPNRNSKQFDDQHPPWMNNKIKDLIIVTIWML